MSQSVASKIKSPINRKIQNESFLLDPMPENSSQTMRSSPEPSNRSGHSFANSINSATPRVGHQSPSFRDRVDTSFMDTLEEMQSLSQESGANSADLLDAALETAIGEMGSITSPIQNRNSGFNAKMNNKNDCVSTRISILPSSSGRSHSPPGFVFKDTEDSGVIGPPDPVGREGFALADSIFGEEDSSSTSTNGQSEKTETTSDDEIKQEILKGDDSVDLEGINKTKEPVYHKQGSSSTKQTVSTSIRSGISSIQNASVEAIANSHPAFNDGNRETEGSTSIRTGLSGLQSQKESNDMENSISIHANNNSIGTNNNTATSLAIEDDKADKKGVSDALVMQKITIESNPKYPDTIEEESEAKSSQKSTFTPKDENTSFSVLKVKSTVTTDGSSGATTGASSSLQVSSDPSDNAGSALNTVRNVLPPIQTEDVKGGETLSIGLSLLSPESRSSRPWKSIGNAIKNVLAKASPRTNGHAANTPSNHSKLEEQDECESLFSDDDDDIFGGLEVEENEKLVKKTMPTMKQKIDENTPKQTNFTSSGRKEGSLSYRTTGTISKRTPISSRRTPTNSRRTPTNNRRTPKNSRRTPKSTRRKSLKSGTPRSDGIIKPAANTPSHNQKRTVLLPAAGEAKNPASLYLNDRFGMVVDGSEVVHNVNSDITSSLIGGPISGPSPFQKAMNEAATTRLLEFGDKANETEASDTFLESDFLIEDEGESFTLLMEETDTSFVERKFSEPLSEGIPEPKEEEQMEMLEEKEEEDKQTNCMFLNFGCGFTDPCSGFASLCTPANKTEYDDVGEETIIGDMDGDKDYISVSSRSQLTSLEKKVWNEWDRLNETVLSPKKTGKIGDKKEDYERKRETARDKLLDIASTALSSQMSIKSGKSTLIDDDQCTKSTITEDHAISASGSTESFFTKETESGASGNSSAIESADSMGSSSQESTHGYSTSYSSGDESDEVSEDPSHSSNVKNTSTTMMTPTAGPILLSFSQRSLMEKFSKQLTAVGVQVLKLNTRKQWQTRFFTVSTEQIALSAHEAISKTGEIAQCPKALLWLKKFSPKNGGYGIINIDKNGHGGMLLVDLVDIQVSDRKDDMVGNPIPKKLMDKFENSVLVTLMYKMKGILRSIEFRCRDNDEAQFLCTCMRVIRDLLRRERSLRQKLSKQASNKKHPSSSSRRT